MSILILFKVTAVLGGVIYYQLSDEANGICTFSQKNKQNISTAAFYAVSVMTLNNVLAAALTFPLEIPIFFHEVFKNHFINNSCLIVFLI